MRFFIIACIASFALGGCGVKPGSLSAPPGAEDTSFPRPYPSPSTVPGAENPAS